MNFNYPHFDTSVPERPSRTGGINVLRVGPLVSSIRRAAFQSQVPVSCDETLQFVLVQAVACGAGNILEIGTATGASGIALLEVCPQARLTTIEKNVSFAREAAANFAAAGVEDRARLIVGDAAEVLPTLSDEYDFVFLDGPKVQYVKWLPRLKALLAKGGLLLADDVLLYGWVDGSVPVPAKRHSLADRIRDYLAAVAADEDLVTSVLRIGEGVAVSVKRRKGGRAGRRG